jgi:predicted CXXCH cytochrome family protein
MAVTAWLLVLGVPALLLGPQLLAALGPRRALKAGLGVLGLGAGTWLLLSWPTDPDTSPAHDLSPAAYVTSETCWKCHASFHASWKQTYHRTMTREATPEFVKGDFHDVAFTVFGVTSRLTREGDAFFMETLDPDWQRHMTRSGRPRPKWGPPRLKKFKVERLVGSHWFQECLYRDSQGTYERLPLSYHIVEGRWIHTNGAFLAPDTPDFWSRSATWNESCVYCHNTKPSKRPHRQFGLAVGGYDTRVAELGIACEACHGPGDRHVRAHQNPARRLVRPAGEADPTIVNPRRLSPSRASEICAHCHGSPLPRPRAWDSDHTDPYTAGDDLTLAYAFFWSEAEQRLLAASGGRPVPRPSRPRADDGRFWGDGTPLTTALEYQGMALSKCFQDGHGQLSCLSCHSMHDSAPHFQVARGMETNDACYRCHAAYRGKLAEHTHHQADSPGSLCYNCHMPHQVYSLLTTHRSHRIEMLQIKDSVGTGKPHACNLCHLDKSLGWTQRYLRQWYGRPTEPLSAEDRTVASTVLHLLRSDARSRAVVAGAFSWKPAQKASGTDWAWPLLLEVLERDRYPAVRYLAHRALRTTHGPRAQPFDYLNDPGQRKTQVAGLRKALADDPRPRKTRYPYLPLHADGLWDHSQIDRLLRQRNDPDVFINE